MRVKVLDFQFLKEAEGFRLDVYSPESSDLLATAYLNFPRGLIDSSEIRYLDFESKDPTSRVTRLSQFGEKLYQQIFTKEILRIWQKEKENQDFIVLRIRTGPNASELEALPWETLFDGHEFISAGSMTTLSRLPLNVQRGFQTSSAVLPLRMLALFSSPLDLPDDRRLQIEREQEILLAAINHSSGQGYVYADFEDEARPEVLEGSLENCYQIFHFSGHGITPENGGGLLLEDEYGGSRPTPVTEIVQLLAKGQNSLRLVVLSGCQTARTADISGFRDLARSLIEGGFPAVIAMQFSISDLGALKFGETLYKSLASGAGLEVATNRARRALLLSDTDFLKADAISPVLMTIDGNCLQTTESSTPNENEYPQIDLSFQVSLPQLGHSFYGRRREYRTVRNAILNGNQRAVIIYGLGGMGKTALAAHLATRLRKHFRGVLALDCSSGTITGETILEKVDEYLVAQGIDALHKLRSQGRPPDIIAGYLSQVLSQWPLLLIFDGFEMLLERGSKGFEIADTNLRIFITALIKGTATKSRFIFTSRYLFDLDEKRVGSAVCSVPLDQLSRPEALSLLQKLQYLSQVSFADKLEILETFGGHPYSLVTLDRYCQHQPLADAFKDAKLIRGELREFLAVELNYLKLSDSARELLNRLAAFRRIFPTEAAEWVMGQTIPLPQEVLDGFADDYHDWDQETMPVDWKDLSGSLLSKKILDVLPETRKGPDINSPIKELIEWGMFTPIYHDKSLWLSIHEIVRAFCRDQQDIERWRQALRDASYFYRNRTKIINSDHLSVDQVNTEIEAYELLIEAENYSEALPILYKVHMPLQRWGYSFYLERQYRALLKKLRPPESAPIWYSLGVLMLQHKEYESAKEMLQHSLRLFEAQGDEGATAKACHEIGIIHHYQGEYDRAVESFLRSMEISEKLHDNKGRAYTLGHLAIIYADKGEYDRALSTLQSVLQMSGSDRDLVSKAVTLHEIGLIHEKLQDFVKALNAYQDSIKIAQQLGDSELMAKCLFQVGNIQLRNQDYENALTSFQSSLELQPESEFLILLLWRMGQIQEHHEKLPEALRSYQGALAIAENIENREAQKDLLIQIAQIHQVLGDYDLAMQMFRQALCVAEELKDESSIAEALGSMGWIHSLRGDNHEALRHCQRGLEIAERLEDYNGVAALLHKMGWINESQGVYDKALEFYERQRSIEEELGSPAGLATALHGIGMVYEGRQEFDTALKYFERELEIDVHDPGAALHHIGIIYYEKQEYCKSPAIMTTN